MQRQHSYPVSSLPIAIDMLPRSNGSDVWWQHTLGQSERDRLDNLIGLALVDQRVHDRLLVQHDPSLLDDFDLSDDTRHWLTGVRASTLKEFAQAIVNASVRPHRMVASG